ncbi:amidohydrolase family protein [Paraburkholderia xenovorans LB400]|uniref:Amidohydrolase-related domain-containing protein n=1 Tax=Paraburkholderia xenovorans (strain LB400) TaxID=266265 RepID=Q13G97_PARXL|nr:amidohydrolase family protein [Paraburkholderia xenovorans]ABE36892.1 Conserved hypothetical protein [Paraburkholderia xenovorans LB400]AIP33912.1 amidohydrolase family protein [Paraburkholderia xenovorans LB400]
MLLIDTHAHVLSPDRTTFPRDYGLDMAWARGDLSAQQLVAAMDESSISKTLLIQAYSAYRYDNSYLESVIGEFPDRFAGVCMVDPLARDVSDRLTSLIVDRKFAGTRIVIVQPEPRLDDPAMAPFYETCAELRTPLCVLTIPPKLKELEVPLSQWPSLQVVVEHLGLIHTASGDSVSKERPLLDLARFPNCILKFSTISLRVAAAFEGGAQGQFERLIDAFGAQRLMWGSDYPSTPEGGIPGLVNEMHQALDFLPHHDLALLSGEAACRIWSTLRPVSSRGLA